MEIRKYTFKHMLLVCLVALGSFASACDDDEEEENPGNLVLFEDVQLSGANVVPAVTTNGSGTLNASYDRNTRIITYSVAWSLGDEDAETINMHFHGPASTKESATPVVDVMGFSNSSSGTLLGSTRALTESEEVDLLAGKWYFNIQSSTYPTGELRGNLLP